MTPTKSEAIKAFLTNMTQPDLASLYHLGMECQVNVAKDNGELVVGEYKGKKWRGWTDGEKVWKTFRIPYKANTDPEYTDAPIKFQLAEHAEAVGMTGWNWQRRVSQWVAFDFDAIVGHSENHTAKLTDAEMDNVVEAAQSIPWVTVRRSTSGSGIHLYVFLKDIPTSNHNEHAALGRAILSQMSALTGFDFKSHADVCGGNMWIWHRKTEGTNGLTLIKEGDVLDKPPANWRDHIGVIRGDSNKTVPSGIKNAGTFTAFAKLAGQYPKVGLGVDHCRLLEFLNSKNMPWIWDQDHNILTCHSKDLEYAHKALKLKGMYSSNSSQSSDMNLFAFPLPDGAWVLRRYGHNVREHELWENDGKWTKCFYNKSPDLSTACAAFNGKEDEHGTFQFNSIAEAINACKALGVDLNLKGDITSRECELKLHKDGRIVMLIPQQEDTHHPDLKNWLLKRKKYIKVFNAKAEVKSKEYTAGVLDNTIRHIVTETGEDCGWVVSHDDRWNSEPLPNVKMVLSSRGFTDKEIKEVLGRSVAECWTLVNKPFQDAYPGGRTWNRDAAQYRFRPKEDTDDLRHPHWDMILEHCGRGLDDSVLTNRWCQENNILTGYDYLKCWVAYLLQKPMQSLPYLFFFGPENCGKSMFHEALALLLTKGIHRADQALTSTGGFNGELAGSILCIVEETNVSVNANAHNRIKDWVTSPEFPIHVKGKQPYSVANSTHWIQCANDPSFCPVFPGDTRITMCYVGDFEGDRMNKEEMKEALKREAPDFMATVMGMDLPTSNERLGVATLDTQEKIAMQQLNQSELVAFIKYKCESIDGHTVDFADFYDAFLMFIGDSEAAAKWSKSKVSKQIPPQHPKGRKVGSSNISIGNIRLMDGSHPDLEPKVGKYKLDNGMLI